MPHPDRDGGNSLAGLNTLFMEEAGLGAVIFPVESHHVAGHIQVHASAAWVCTIDGLDNKIDIIGVVLRGTIHTRTNSNFHP